MYLSKYFFSIYFHQKLHKIANIVNFVYYEKTRLYSNIAMEYYSCSLLDSLKVKVPANYTGTTSQISHTYFIFFLLNKRFVKSVQGKVLGTRYQVFFIALFLRVATITGQRNFTTKLNANRFRGCARFLEFLTIFP